MKKIANIVLLVLIAVAAVAVAMWLFSENPGGVEGGPPANVGPMINVTYAFLGLALVLLIGLTVMNMGKGRGNSKIGLFVFGGLAILAVIIYFTIAKDVTIIGADKTKVFDDTFTLKITDTMLYSTYIALALTVVFLLWGVVRKALK